MFLQKKLLRSSACMAIVTGNMPAKSPQNPDIILCRCESWKLEERWFDPGEPSDHVSLLPDWDIGDILEICVVFPQFWDNQNLGSAQFKNHMAYPSHASLPKAETGSCPKSHSIVNPQNSYNCGIYIMQNEALKYVPLFSRSWNTWVWRSDTWCRLHKRLGRRYYEEIFR